MKLYYSPGACSLATRITLHEASLSAEFERVDLKAKVTEHGRDFTAIAAKGCVPVLVLDDGAAVTENVAVLDLLVQREPELGVGGPLGRTRLLEMLSYLSSELHIAFKPFFHDAGETEKSAAAEAVTKRLAFLEDQLRDDYLFGPEFTVADAYFFAMLRWTALFDLPLSARLQDYFARISQRDAVRRALAEENLT